MAAAVAAPSTAPATTLRHVQRDRRGPGHRPSGAELKSQAKHKRAASQGQVTRPTPVTAGRTAPTQPGRVWAQAEAAGPISSGGPLTRIATSADLNCSVNYAGDTAGEFYGGTACGTFAAVNGTLYGPANIPAGGNASPRTAWSPVSQAGPSGAGTASDPYVITTTVDAGSTGLRVVQTDSYVSGQNYYRTDVRLQNTTGSALQVRIWRAADCYLGDSDHGYGAVNSRLGTIGCRQGSRLEQWQPLTPGSHYYEDGYSAVWARIGAQQPFPDSCARCTEFVDNGAGLSWDVTVDGGAASTVSHRTNFTTTLPELDLEATFGPDCTCDSLGSDVNLQARTGRPINTATGSEAEAFTDASYPGPGIPFAFTRFYNSADRGDGPFGQGWTFPYQASLRQNEDGSVQVRAESGAQARYTPAADGTYTTPPGVRSRLTRSESTWVLTAPDGHTLTFDAQGRFTAIRDRVGQGVTAGYDGDRLATLTDAAGRRVSLTWTGEHLTRLTLADGRHVEYAFTGDRLTSVRDLRGKVSELAYNDQGLLTSVKDPNGHFRFRNTYDPTTGRVTEQLDPLGNRTTFGWDLERQIATRTDARGNTWTEYYAGNVLLEQTDPLGNAWLYDYDQQLRLTAVTDPRGNTTTYAYNELGEISSETGPAPSNHTRQWQWDTDRHLLTSYRDRNGKVTTYTYTEAGLPESITTPTGATTSYTYTGRGLLATRTTARGKVWRYGYDDAGNLTFEVSPAGHRTTYGYDGTGRRTSQTTPRGNAAGADAAAFTSTSTYDDGDLLTVVAQPLGRTLRFGYDDAGNQIASTDAAGATTRTEYDAADRPTKVTDPLGHAQQAVYDEVGNVTARVDSRGRTTYGFDAANRMTSVTTARGNEPGATAAAYTWTYTYNAAGGRTSSSHPDPAGGAELVALTNYDELNRPTSQTDPLGHTTTTTYDPEHGPATVKNALGDTASNEYDPDGRLVRTTDPLGKATSFAYDADGNQTASTLPGGQSTRWTYDDDGRPATSVEARGLTAGADAGAYTTTYGYDADGHRVSQRDPLGHTTAWQFDQAGRLVATIDALDRRIQYAYDDADRLLAVTDPTSARTTYAYDAAGRLTTRTDANNHGTRYEYDDEDRLTGLQTPGDHRYGYRYTAEGQLDRTVTGRGTIDVTVDTLGRRSRLDYSDATPDESFTYDRGGRLARTDDGAGTTTYGYDDADRLTSTTRDGATVRYAYDANGRLVQRTNPSGITTSLSYDDNGRQTSLEDATGTTAFAYDAAGNLLTVTTPDGVRAQHTWDAAGRETGVVHARGDQVIASYTRTLDATGTTTVQRSAVGDVTRDTAYEYDAANRLVAECAGATCAAAGSRTRYTYDPVGNRLSADATGTAGQTQYAYDADDRMIRATRGGQTATYDYDADGNQLTTGAPGTQPTRLQFDLANRLSRAQRDAPEHPGAGAPAAGVLAAGFDHTLAVRADGTLWAFGKNHRGQLGIGTGSGNAGPAHTPGPNHVATPQRVTTPGPVASVAAGGSHSLALTRAGDVLAFGDNTAGESGPTRASTVRTPTRIGGLTATAVAAGNRHSLALRADGTVVAWGANNEGQLGVGTAGKARNTPVQVAGLTGVRAVAAGGAGDAGGHSLAVRADGTVWAWGDGRSGQLGTGQTGRRSSPTKVQGLSNVKAVAAGGQTSYALTSDGTVWAWGDNAQGQLGTGTGAKSSTKPVRLGFTGITSVAAGTSHALAIGARGQVWAWGDNRVGQLGDNGACGRTCRAPVRINLTDATVVAAGGAHSVAALTDGTGRAWGSGDDGELGTGTTANARTPQRITGLDNLRAGSGSAEEPVDPGTGAVDVRYTHESSGLRASATSGGTTSAYRWDTTTPLPTLLTDGRADYSHDPTGAPLTGRPHAGGSADRFYREDPLGTVRLTTAADGSTVSKLDVNAFGEPTARTGAAAPFGFAGQLTDETGLPYMRARSYDPASGRFLSTDPVAPRIEDPYVSTYVYARGNPATWTDPSGECLLVCAAIGAGVGAVVGGVGYAVTHRGDDFSWSELGKSAAKGAVVGGVVGLTGGLGAAAAPALGISATAGAAVGGAAGSVASNWAVNTALGEPYTGRDALIDGALGLGAPFVPGVASRLRPVVQGLFAGVSRAALRAAGACGHLFRRVRGRSGGTGVAPQALLNRAGRLYPNVIDPRTGSAIPHPGPGLSRVPVSERVPWGAQERGKFIKEWYDRGFETPAGGWSQYDIHHIRPREYGGTNAFENLVPLLRTVHQQEFNAWWRAY
jgi:RHS repeat-associated protein